MNTENLKKEAFYVNDLLSEYVEIHNGIIGDSGFMSLFRKINFKAWTNKVSDLLEKFREERARLSEIRKLQGTDEEVKFAECLFLYTEALTETVRLLFLKSQALQEKSEGKKLSFLQHMENEKKYQHARDEYSKLGERLNNLFGAL